MSVVLQDLESGAAGDVYRYYWREFYSRLGEYTAALQFNSGAEDLSKNYVRLINTGIGKVFFSAVASVEEREIEADFTIENDSKSKEIFKEIGDHKRDIECFLVGAWSGKIFREKRNAGFS